MMDNNFEKLKKEIEDELGRPIDQGEEFTIKALYYFGKGMKLKNQVESEPCRLGEILPGVMKNIKRRMERHRKKIREAGKISSKENG